MTVELRAQDVSGNQSVPIQFLRANYTYECKLSSRNFVRDAKDVLYQLGQVSASLEHMKDVIQHLPFVPHINRYQQQKRDIADCLRACIDYAVVLLQGED